MKSRLLILCFLFPAKLLLAQVPILYYDFENNSTRTTFENLVEQSVNSGCSIITQSGIASMAGIAGAGASYGGANGEAISANNTWSTVTSDPGTGAITYFQFTANTSGFSGLSIQFDCQASNSILGLLGVGPQNAGILYSTDGTTFHATSTKSTGTLGAWNHLNFDLSSITAINNQSSVVFRLYGYNASDYFNILLGHVIANTTGTLSIDNLQVSALSTVSNAGTVTLLDEAGIYTSTTSGTTGSIFSRQNFTVSGTSTTVNMGQEKFSGSGTFAGSLTVQDTAILNITSAVTIDSAIVATSTPLSTLNVTSYGTVNLAGANLLCKGTTTVSNTGIFNCSTNTVTSMGTFTVSSGGNLYIGSTAGISSSGATGNIQTTIRSFSTSGNYLYNAAASQVTGSGLPSTINNLTVNSSGNLSLTNNLTVNGQTTLSTSSLIIGTKTLTLNGIVTRASGTFDGTENSILILGGSSAQDIGFDANDTLSTLTINKSSGSTATLNSALNIFTGISFNPANLGTLDLNNEHVTLKSNATFTAYFGTLYGNVNNATNVTIERYVPAHRAWRLMATPISTTSAPTINAAWQEGGVVATPGTTVNPNPGYGTHITGGASGLGFDRNNVNNPSIKAYNISTSKWDNIVNTNSTVMTDYPAYMLFVRGSRAVVLNMNQYAATDNTVLRMTGKLLTGAQTYSAAAAGFKLLSNPYACTINFTTTTKSGMPDTYYLWDPLLTGGNAVGAFVTLIRHGAGYLAAPSPLSPIDLNGSIESGAAFFVNFVTAGSLQINETDKTTGSAVVFRPTNNDDVLFRTNLYSIETDSSISLLDGVVTGYDASYSNDVDNMDAVKLSNSTENVSMLRNGKSLAIEMRQPVQTTDSIFFQMNQLQQKTYRLQFIPTDFNQPSLTGILQDSYLNTNTPVSLSDTTVVSFSVNADAASFSANRFKIVFNNGSAILPVKFISVNALKQNNNIVVKWQSANETNNSHYEIERSANGQQFSKTATMNVSKNFNGNYNWTDADPLSGNNYYRIKSVDGNGNVLYSIVVQVIFGNDKIENDIVYPNPVVKPVIQLHLLNEPAGEYNVRLINLSGESVFSGLIKHNLNAETDKVNLPSAISNNIYQVDITKPDGSKIVTSCLVQ
jgi:hypothetical protein